MECYCGHYYCKKCKREWLQTTIEPSQNEKCKSCHSDVNPYGMVRNNHRLGPSNNSIDLRFNYILHTYRENESYYR